jgi:hypothetical protein
MLGRSSSDAASDVTCVLLISQDLLVATSSPTQLLEVWWFENTPCIGGFKPPVLWTSTEPSYGATFLSPGFFNADHQPGKR